MVKWREDVLGHSVKRALVTSRFATAGNSIGAYSLLVPSIRIAPVAMTTSPLFTSVCIPPQVSIQAVQIHRIFILSPAFVISKI